MAVTLEVRISDLLPEFFADALILLCPLQAARAVTAGTLQPVPDHLHHFLIVIKSDRHTVTSFPQYYKTSGKIVKLPQRINILRQSRNYP